MSLVCYLSSCWSLLFSFFFFFNDTATTEIYTLSLHDALPISRWATCRWTSHGWGSPPPRDRKSTRLNSSHVKISYAVFCLKKKKKKESRCNLKKKKKKRENRSCGRRIR